MLATHDVSTLLGLSQGGAIIASFYRRGRLPMVKDMESTVLTPAHGI
jgi:hypothetical protein